ncbi:putative SNF2 N-terminal domain-containing protein [Seiridium cardinale]
MANDASGNVDFGPVLGILRQLQEDNASILKAVEANNERSPLGGLVAVTWRPEPDVRPLINLVRDRPPSDDPNENPNMDKLIQWIGAPFDGKRIRILNIDSKGTNLEVDTDLDLWMLFRRIQQGDLELPKFRDVLSIQFDNPGSPHSPAEEPPQADPEKEPVAQRPPQPNPKTATPGPGGKISPRAPVGSPRPTSPWTPPAPKPPIRPGVGGPSDEPSGGPSNPGRASRPGQPPRPNIGVPPGGPKDPKAPAPTPRRPKVGFPGSRDDPIVLGGGGGDDDEDQDEDEPDDDISDIGSQHDSPVIDALGVNQILDDPEHWRKVCQFFQQTDPSFHDIIVPGLKRPLRPHQAAVVYWLLTSLCDGKVAGPMLSDEMGLGKTFDVISIIVIYAYLHLMWQDCRSSWHPGARMSQVSRHLPKTDRSGKPCPSQMGKKFGIECPCRFDSASRRIVTSQEDSPTIIICLANLVTTWMTEWEKFVDTSVGSPAAGMKLHTNVDAQRLNRAYYKKEADIVPLTSSNHKDHFKFVLNPDDPADVGILLSGFPGGSQHVILTTPRSIDKLKDAYTVDIRHRDSRKPDLTVNMLAPAWIFMDEVHKYLGKSGPDSTLPFKVLNGIRLQSKKPPVAVGVSGSLQPSGPEYWRSFFRHTMRVIKDEDWKEKDWPKGFSEMNLTTDDDLHKLGLRWKYLQEHIGDSSEAVRGVVSEYIREDSEKYKKIFPAMIIRRRKQDKFGSKTIVSLPPSEVQEVQLDVKPGSAFDAQRLVVAGVRTWVLREFRRLYTEWERKKGNYDQGPEPTLQYTEQKLLGGARMEVGPSREKNSAFWLSQRCTTFPTLAKLWMDKSVGHDRFDGSKMEELAADFNGAYLQPLGDPAFIRSRTIQALGNSPFYTHRKILRDESEKFWELCKIIDEIRRIRDPNAKQPYPGPSDGSLLRHMVVFCETPITAYLVAMLLFCRYRNLDVLLFHATLPFKSSKTRPWLSRETMLQNFSADCRPGDNPKVLIGTFNLLAEGLNLQRANYAVLIDLARERQREQARDRIARQGQTQKTFIYQFWASNNIFEVQRRDRNRTEAILGSSSKWFKANGTAIDWAYFGLDESSDVNLNDESDAGQDNAGEAGNKTTGGDEFDDIYD